MNILDKVLNLIIPRKCAGCGAPSEIYCPACINASYSERTACLFCGQRNLTGEVCTQCKKRVKASLKHVLWAGRYDDELKKAIWALKYGKRKEMAKPLGEMLARKFFEIYVTKPPGKKSDFPGKSDFEKGGFAVIPIPLHFKKEHERGFNQAELLAREFCKITNLSLLTNVLQKTKETQEQVKVENKELRFTNLADAFEIRNDPPTPPYFKGGETVILIDDVSTTGATLTHAANALSDAGAKNIIGLVVAHGGQ